MDTPGSCIAEAGTRYLTNDPLLESLNFVLGTQEHRWDVKWPSTDTGNVIDSFTQP